MAPRGKSASNPALSQATLASLPSSHLRETSDDDESTVATYDSQRIGVPGDMMDLNAFNELTKYTQKMLTDNSEIISRVVASATTFCSGKTIPGSLRVTDKGALPSYLASLHGNAVNTPTVPKQKKNKKEMADVIIEEPETSDTNTPITNTPITNTPITNTPITNTPITNTPITNTPVTNTPVTDDNSEEFHDITEENDDDIYKFYTGSTKDNWITTLNTLKANVLHDTNSDWVFQKNEKSGKISIKALGVRDVTVKKLGYRSFLPDEQIIAEKFF